jgi:putative PIN family toxin of toxin-antitoxin system
MRVFLDTNVLASATAARGLCADVLRTAFEFHNVVVSDELLQELRRVLRDKFHAPADAIAEVVWLLGQDTIEARSVPLADVPLKDPADIAIVSAAINGGADVLVTGDKEVLALKRAGTLKIISPRQFWDMVRGQFK